MDDARAASYSFVPSDVAPPVVERAEGCTLHLADGRAVIDAGAGAIAVNIGHGRAEVADAVAEATRRVSYVLPPWVTEERIALVELLREKWLPEGLTRVGFTSGGSESVDSAVRLALAHHASAGRPERRKVIGREASYHGLTMTALAVGGHRGRRAAFEHVLADHPKMPVDDAEGLEKVLWDEGPETVAALIAEPVIGATAGAVVPPDGWWTDVRALCDQHGVLLIADEVMTGFGRTGRRFGVDHWDVVPDLLVGGKGLSGGYAPLGGVFATDELVAPIAASGEVVMFFTYSAHSAACAAGVAALGILDDEDLVAASAVKGTDLLDRLSAVAEQPHVAEVRGLGLMVGVELQAAPGEPYPASEGMGARVVAEAMDRGVWVYPAGDGNVPDALLIGPPFTITNAEMDEVVRVVDESILAVCGD
ncbi:MAG: hypothetical protein CL466_09055 [Acidimicrobiaceae bacterium]|nr:hypothetical protein [Acidimicrobiaceae bacterium]